MHDSVGQAMVSTGAVIVLLAILTPAPSDATAAPAPVVKKTPSGILVLDNCDPLFRGKGTYDDNLTAIDASGKVTFRVSGFNNCEAIGSNHMIAVDAKRGWIWAQENVGKRIRKFDRKSKELLSIKAIDGSAIAVDPETGNLWVLATRGTIYGDKIVVHDAKGKQIATHAVSGWDIVYDSKSKSFWIAGQSLIKIDAKTGKAAFNKKITTWCASSLTVHHKTGKVWVAIRQHPQVAGSKNQLLGFDNDGALKHTIELGTQDPFRVSVDQATGAVWLTIFGKGVQRYSAEGKKEATLEFNVLAAEADLTSRDVWVATPEEVLRVNTQGKVLKRIKHKSETSQVWLVSW